MNKVMSFLPVIFVAAVIAHEKFRQKGIRNEYDEMQLEIRGRGAWYGFYAMILYWACCFILENTFELRFLTAGNAVFLGIMISGSVVVGYSILHDSYYGMNRPASKNIYFLCLIVLIEFICVGVFIVMLTQGVFSDLKAPCGDERIMLVLCIPMFTTILITTLIRRLKPEEEDA